MKRVLIRVVTCMAVTMAGALLGACHDDHNSGGTPPDTSSPPSVNFSTFATEAFKADANATPVRLDNVTIVYDVNDDPTAFAALLM